jgi:ATP-dependent DNA helicase RecG
MCSLYSPARRSLEICYDTANGMDSTALILSERVANNIQLGESHIREFKSAYEGLPDGKKPRSVKDVCREVGEQLVGFANADGGDLLIGVEDDGALTGVPYDETAIQTILDAVRTHVYAGQVLPLTYATAVTLKNKTVLFFAVTKGTHQIYQLPDGRCMRRKDKECLPVSFNDIQFERQEVHSREFERQFVDGATVTDLDLEELQIAANSYLKGLSVERYLQQVGLSEYSPGGLRLRMAALLLFAKDIRRWHPRCQIRILRVLGTTLGHGASYNVKEDITEEGNIFKLLVRGWDLLRSTFLVRRTEFGEGAKFEPKFVYPEQACREALINAIAHRDYSVQSGIDIFVYDDRMEVKSPGGLLSTLRLSDLEELKGAHESRNPVIARLLREHRYMRELGEGMRRIFEAMEQSDLEKPRLLSDGQSFSILLSNKSLFDQKAEDWLSVFQAAKLSRLQKRIVVAGIGGKELSPEGIYRAMNTNDRDTYDLEVTRLRKSGILQEIRSSSAAQQMARARRVPKGKVPRFRVVSQSVKAAQPEATLKASSLIRRELFPEETGVFVGNLGNETTEHDLRSVFQRFGTVRKIITGFDKRPGSGARYAVVWLETAEAAQKAIDALYGFKVNNRELVLKRFRARSQPMRR